MAELTCLPLFSEVQ